MFRYSPSPPAIIKTFSFLFIIASPVKSLELPNPLSPEDARLDFTGIVKKYGHISEDFDVTTEDGYVLKLYHIKGNKNKHVLALHGILSTGDLFVTRGKEAIGIQLADAGYDVWILNNRGNRYSRKHITLDPDTDKKYWDFSFNEMGYYDLPATIDFILERTATSQIKIIGYSQGTSISFIMTSLRPEYNDKVEMLLALAPIAFMEHSKLKPLAKIWPLIDTVFKTIGAEEFLRYDSILDMLVRALCNQSINYNLCRDVLYLIVGTDREQFNSEFVPVFFGHVPAGTSRRDVTHLFQFIEGKQFSQYDFGPVENLARYGNVEPPSYNIKNIKMPVAMLVGKNDPLATVTDVEHLREQLPNVVFYHLMERSEFNHFDFVWAKDLKELVIPFIFDLIENYPKK